MSNLSRSDLVWAGWLLLFLVLELTAVFKVAPWVTLSETSWLNEKQYPILRTILFGFLLGLGVHIRFQTGLWRTTLGGMMIAVILNYLWVTSNA
jgi:hypothetical protein